MRRIAHWSLARIVLIALGVVLLATVVGMVRAVRGIGAAGSAGIGAVSIGFSEAVVELAAVVVSLVFIRSIVRRHRR